MRIRSRLDVRYRADFVCLTPSNRRGSDAALAGTFDPSATFGRWNLTERADRTTFGICKFRVVIFKSKQGNSKLVERAEVALMTNLQNSCCA